MTALDDHDRQLLALLTAKNNLESFIYDMRDKLEHDSNYKKASTSDDVTEINDKLSEVDAWLWDDGIDADVKTLKSKLDELKTLTKALVLRVREAEYRPKKIQDLKDALNHTDSFIQATKLLFLKKLDDEKPFTESELKSLEKVLDEVQTWKDDVLREFDSLKSTDTPKYLSTDIDEKILLLKRETNYLIGKIQRFVPKPKPTTTTTPKVPVNNETKVEEQEEENATPPPEQNTTSEETPTTTTTTTTEQGIQLMKFDYFD